MSCDLETMLGPLKTAQHRACWRENRKQSPAIILWKRQGSTEQTDSISNNHWLQQQLGFVFKTNDCKEKESIITDIKHRIINMRQTLYDKLHSGCCHHTSDTLWILLHPMLPPSALQTLINQVLASISYNMQYHGRVTILSLTYYNN